MLLRLPHKLTLATGSLVFGFFFFRPSVENAEQYTPRRGRGGSMLDGCYHVYLDMGTNVGIQIRKLFQPHLFPNAGVLPLFDKYFGPYSQRNRQSVCVVGFEPNPEHSSRLKALEKSFTECGWKVMIFTSTGVGKENTVKEFVPIKSVYWDFTDTEQILWEEGQEKGGLSRLLDTQEEKERIKARLASEETISEVQVKRIAEFINKEVGTRRIPDDGTAGRPPAVVMKLDVEGRELEVVPDLLMSGALAHLDNLHVDWSWSGAPCVPGVFCGDVLLTDRQKQEVLELRRAMLFLSSIAQQENLTHVTEVSGEDDESYHDFDGPLPVC